MGFSVTHLLVVLAIVTVVFGTKRLSNIGADLGGAIKGFRTAMKEVDNCTDAEKISPKAGVLSAVGAVVEKNDNDY